MAPHHPVETRHHSTAYDKRVQRGQPSGRVWAVQRWRLCCSICRMRAQWTGLYKGGRPVLETMASGLRRRVVKLGLDNVIGEIVIPNDRVVRRYTTCEEIQRPGVPGVKLHEADGVGNGIDARMALAFCDLARPSLCFLVYYFICLPW